MHTSAAVSWIFFIKYTDKITYFLELKMQPKYKVDEKVLCYHGPLLYEAKCTKFKKEGNSYTYLIHYQGKVNKSRDMTLTENWLK